MKIRAFYKPNGEVILMYLVRPLKEGETYEQALDAESSRASYGTLPHDDYDPKDFPDKTKKDKWRGEKGKGIWIDESIVTPKELIAQKKKELQEELAKESPDPVKVVRMFMNLKEGK